jgi:putative transposase
VLTVVRDSDDVPAGPVDGASLIDEIVREGARRMLAAALEAEVAAYLAAHAGELDERGRRLVVRNGHAEPRQVLTSAGAVPVRAPRVNDKRVDETTGERQRFSSAILPPAPQDPEGCFIPNGRPYLVQGHGAAEADGEVEQVGWSGVAGGDRP